MGWGVSVSRSSFAVVVDYNKPLKQMINAGRYVSVDDRITEREFPATKKGLDTVEIVLLHIHASGFDSGDVFSLIGDEHCRAAELPELLRL